MNVKESLKLQVSKHEGLLSSFSREDKYIVQLILLLTHELFEGYVVHISASHEGSLASSTGHVTRYSFVCKSR